MNILVIYYFNQQISIYIQLDSPTENSKLTFHLIRAIGIIWLKLHYMGLDATKPAFGVSVKVIPKSACSPTGTT